MNSDASALLFAGLLVFLLSASTAHTQNTGLQSVNQLTVIDAYGKRVGTVLSAETSVFDNPLWVALKVGGVSFLIGVKRNAFIGTLGLVFESTNCSGTAFMQSLPELVLPYSAIRDQTVYLPDPQSTPRSVNFRSVLSDRHSPNCFQNSGTILAIPTITVIELRREFTPPFAVR